jgi:hypothetical protein
MTSSIPGPHHMGSLQFHTIRAPRTPAETGSLSRERVVTITDARFPSGSARLLAWDVTPQGRHDLSSWLCRCDAGGYFMLRRPGNRPDTPHSVVPVSLEQAAQWYAEHSTHVGSWDDPRDQYPDNAPVDKPPTVAD